MTDEELKKKCTERAKIFQQAMESCHSSSPIDCIEWFADSIAELEQENAELKEKLGDVQMQKAGEKSDLVWKLKTANEQKAEQLTKAKEIIEKVAKMYRYSPRVEEIIEQAEQFLRKVEK